MLAPPFDIDLLALVNQPGHPALDAVMSALSSPLALLLLLIVVGLAIYLRSPHKKAGPLLLILAVSATDLTAARVIKPWAARLRPCNESPSASRTLTSCQKGQSLPSSHAANVAAAAVVAAWALPQLTALFVITAGAVGLSRVYLGQHWPTDVLAGWILGALIAFLCIQLSRLRYLKGRELPHIRH